MTYEIRLVGHSGRLAEVYMMDADCLQDAIARADRLVRTHPEIAGAQVARQAEPDSATIH